MVSSCLYTVHLVPLLSLLEAWAPGGRTMKMSSPAENGTRIASKKLLAVSFPRGLHSVVSPVLEVVLHAPCTLLLQHHLGRHRE